MALMGAGTWLAPAVLHRVGARSTLALALALLALGCALRLVPAWLIATAALCGVGVALVQGVLPGLIKLHTPHHVAPMMGVYSAALMSGGALGAQLSPLALQWGVDWRGALALWSLPVLAALALAWRQLGRMAAPAATGTRGGATAWLLRRPRTWYLMLAFGLMNGGYASMVAWLAPHYQELGLSAARSGTLVAVLSIAQAVAALLLPVLGHARRARSPALALAHARLPGAGFRAAGQGSPGCAAGHCHRAGRGPGRLLHLLHAGGAGPSARTAAGRCAERADAGRRLSTLGPADLADGTAAPGQRRLFQRLVDAVRHRAARCGAGGTLCARAVRARDAPAGAVKPRARICP
ncbi:major facilitator transporter [Alicycliphilus sp. B1]|nr:major facilitator transporter [Alicycliphilus sp. B1]